MIGGITLILVLALMGGLIAYLGDKLGSKIGKKRLRLFGLRPHDTSVLMTILSGILVAALTITVLTISSKEVRTALFGMKKMRAEIASLTTARDQANQELSAQNAKIQELDQKIGEATAAADQARQQEAAAKAQMAQAQARMQQAQADLEQLQARYSEASARLQEAQAQVRQAEAARDKLQQDVKSLEDTAKKLQAGIMAVREGDVVFRSGEILYSGVLKGGQKEEETQKQLQDFLNQANIQVAGRIGVDPSTPVIWLSREAVESAADKLGSAKGYVCPGLRRRQHPVRRSGGVPSGNGGGQGGLSPGYPDPGPGHYRGSRFQPVRSGPDGLFEVREPHRPGRWSHPQSHYRGCGSHYQYRTVQRQRKDPQPGRPGHHYRPGPEGYHRGRSRAAGSGDPPVRRAAP